MVPRGRPQPLARRCREITAAGHRWKLTLWQQAVAMLCQQALNSIEQFIQFERFAHTNQFTLLHFLLW
jgi:hypothetical protein